MIMNECEVKHKHADMVNTLSVEDSKVYMCMKAERPVMVFQMSQINCPSSNEMELSFVFSQITSAFSLLF